MRRKHRTRRNRDDAGVSAVIGEILLLLVFASLAGAVMAAFGTPSAPVTLRHSFIDAVASCGQNGWNTGDEQVVLTHRGGSPLDANRVKIRLEIGGSTFDYPDVSAGLYPSGPLDIGTSWASQPRTLTATMRIAWHVFYTNAEANGASQVVDEGVVRTFRCGLLAGKGGVSTQGFGVLPYLDANCNFAYDAGIDTLVDKLDLSGGFYQTAPGKCLALPPGSGDVSAPQIQLVSPGGGLLIGVNLTATNGDLMLTSIGGQIRILPGMQARAVFDVNLTAGGPIVLQGATVTSDRSTILINSNGSLINAQGATITAGALIDRSADGVPIVSVPGQGGGGSVRVCMVMDVQDHVSNGWQFVGQSFAEPPAPSIPPPPVTGYATSVFLPTTSWATPITLNADVLFNDGRPDAECVTYNNLRIDHVLYGQETLSPASGWLTPKYNDQLDVSIQVLTDFFPYQNQLFTPGVADDAARNQNADGDISLDAGRPFRTLVLLNQYNGVRPPEILITSGGGPIQLADAVIKAYDSDIWVNSGVGTIDAARVVAHAYGDTAQVQFKSTGGAIDVSNGALTADTGKVLVDAGAGSITAVTSIVRGLQNVEFTANNGMTITSAQVTSTGADLRLTVTAGHVVALQGARFVDRNNKAQIIPTGAFTGTPALGGTE
jgi:hypothetical protein